MVHFKGVLLLNDSSCGFKLKRDVLLLLSVGCSADRLCLLEGIARTFVMFRRLG